MTQADVWEESFELVVDLLVGLDTRLDRLEQAVGVPAPAAGVGPVAPEARRPGPGSEQPDGAERAERPERPVWAADLADRLTRLEQAVAGTPGAGPALGRAPSAAASSSVRSRAPLRARARRPLLRRLAALLTLLRS